MWVGGQGGEDGPLRVVRLAEDLVLHQVELVTDTKPAHSSWLPVSVTTILVPVSVTTILVPVPVTTILVPVSVTTILVTCVYEYHSGTCVYECHLWLPVSMNTTSGNLCL